MKRIAVIDLMNLAFRAYWGHAQQPLFHEGKPTSVCYGVASSFNRILKELNPDYVIVAAEGGGKTFRHELYSDYKSNRTAPPADFLEQLPDLNRMIDAYGFRKIRIPGIEGDDIIGSASKQIPEMIKENDFKNGIEDDTVVYIVSGDKDFAQLVTDRVMLFRPSFDGYETMGPKEVELKFGVTPDRIVDYMAITGDTADSIPGVHGVGPKGAQQLIRALGTLESVYENIHGIKPALANKLTKSKDSAELSKKLVKIDTSVRLDTTPEECRISSDPLERKELLEFYMDMGFKSLVMSVMGLG